MIFEEILRTVFLNSKNKREYFENFLELYKNSNKNLYPTLREKYSVHDFNLDGNYYLIERNSKFNFDYILYVPNKLKYNTLLVEGANGSKLVEYGQGDYEWLSEDDNRYIGIIIDHLATSSGLLLNDGVAIMVPIIPDYRSREKINGREFFARQYSRNSLIVEDENNRFYNFDRQIIYMINDAKERVEEITNISFEEKIAMYGFSTSSKFAFRFTMCHPEMVSLVAAGGVGAQNILPFEELNGFNLIYPVGVSDLESITGNKFNANGFKNIKQFYYLGDQDTNDTVASLNHHDQPIIDLYNGVFNNKNMQERFIEISKLYADFQNVSFKLYKGSGHDHFAAIDDVRSFMYSNMPIISVDKSLM